MKIGDKVRVVSTIYNSPDLAVGQTGVIAVDCAGEGIVFGVLMDNGHKPSHPIFYLDDTPTWAYLPEELELVQ